MSGYVQPLIGRYLSSLGHTASAHFKAMWNGYEEVDEPAPGQALVAKVVIVP